MNSLWFIKIWEDKKYFDLWHLNHFLAGALLGFLAIFYNFSFWIGLSIALIPMILWEFLELKLHPEETPFNKLFDVVFGIIGFFTVWIIYRYKDISFNISFTATLFFWLFLETWGYWAYFKKRVKINL